MGVTITPIEVSLFEVVVFVLKLLLDIALAQVSIELTRDIGPAYTRWAVARPVA
jgi:hypothetical protein